MSDEFEYQIPKKGTPSEYKLSTFESEEPNTAPIETPRANHHEEETLQSIPRKQPPQEHSAVEVEEEEEWALPWKSTSKQTNETETADAPSPVTASPAKKSVRKPILKILTPTQAISQRPPRKQIAPVEIPHAVLDLFTKQNADKNCAPLFKSYCEEVASICPGRVTLSLQDEIICVWNYDEGIPFAFFSILNSQLYCGLEEGLVPSQEAKKTWGPPKWLFPEPVVFFLIEEITPMILSRTEQASLASLQDDKKIAL